MNAINKENNRSRILPLIITKIDKLLKFIREVKDPYANIAIFYEARAFYTRLIIISEWKDFPKGENHMSLETKNADFPQ